MVGFLATTNGWAVLEALSTLGGTIVLAGGAVAGVLYGRTGDIDVTGMVNKRPGGLVVVVTASMHARGIRTIKVRTESGHTPTMRVTEVMGDGPEDAPPP